MTRRRETPHGDSRADRTARDEREEGAAVSASLWHVELLVGDRWVPVQREGKPCHFEHGEAQAESSRQVRRARALGMATASDLVRLVACRAKAAR